MTQADSGRPARPDTRPNAGQQPPRLPRHQRGLSFFGWFMVLLVGGAVASLAIRLIPFYLDHNTLNKVVGQYVATGEASAASKTKLRNDVTKRLRMNNIRDLQVGAIMERERDPKTGVTNLVFDYEIREHLVHNIDVVLSFHSEFPLTDSK